MVFKYEEDSYLKFIKSNVVSCDSAIIEWTPPGKTQPQEIKGFDVVLEDTVLCPEVGGQPCDYGMIAGCEVRRVVRKGNKVIHFIETDKKLAFGSEVPVQLDWPRRISHMQHHSGQHLLTALFSRQYNYETTSWWLGSETACIELDTTHIPTRDSLDLIEDLANVQIRNGVAVTVEYVDSDDVRALEGARLHDLPKNHIGPVRLVQIGNYEKDACWGTHVTNLSQLQCVKILNAEKTKNGVNIHFISGDRVRKRLAQCLKREQDLKEYLDAEPKEHYELVRKLNKDLRTKATSLEKALKDLAIFEVEKSEGTRNFCPKYYILHRYDGNEPIFINTFLRHAPEDRFYFLTVSEYIGKGHMVLRGDGAAIEKLAPQFLEILDGKGAGCEGTFQAKFNRASELQRCDALIGEYYCED